MSVSNIDKLYMFIPQGIRQKLITSTSNHDQWTMYVRHSIHPCGSFGMQRIHAETPPSDGSVYENRSLLLPIELILKALT